MNLYVVTIRQSTVTFSLLISADTVRAARRRAGKRIRRDYAGFHIYRIDQ